MSIGMLIENFQRLFRVAAAKLGTRIGSHRPAEFSRAAFVVHDEQV